MKIYFIWIISAVFLINAETLFEVKDSSNNKVLDVSTDGLRILNQGDTLMVISANAIRANISNSKGLSRSFSVTTSASKGKGLINALQVDATSTSMSAPDGDYTNFSPLNILMGLEAGASIGPGKYNVMIGNYAGFGTVGVTDYSYFGWSNTFLGESAGRYATNSSHNVYIGKSSGSNNSDGGDNAFMGTNSGQNNLGSCNTFIGSSSGGNGTGSGSFNTYLGYLSGAYTSTGSYNVMLGDRAGYNLRGGNSNVSVGYRAGYQNQAGIGNVFIGNETGFNETGSNKLYIDNSSTATPLIYGDFSSDALTVNGTLTSTGNITGNGTSLRLSTNPGTGTTPTNYFYQGLTGSTAKSNAFTVHDAMWVTNNAFFDANMTVSGVLDINGTSDQAIKVDGLEALWLGQNASSQNYFSWGYGALYNYFADRITIGNTAYNSSYVLYVNGSAFATGSWSSSDKRFKKNISGINGALDKIARINGVSYSWRSDEFKEKGFDEGTHYGVIAQDLEEVVPEAVKTDSEGYKAVAYDELIPILIEAVKELKAENDLLKKRIGAVESYLNKK